MLISQRFSNTERKEHDGLKAYKYTYLRHRDTLSDKQATALADLIKRYPTLVEAYRLQELFKDLWSLVLSRALLNNSGLNTAFWIVNWH